MGVSDLGMGFSSVGEKSEEFEGFNAGQLMGEKLVCSKLLTQDLSTWIQRECISHVPASKLTHADISVVQKLNALVAGVFKDFVVERVHFSGGALDALKEAVCSKAQKSADPHAAIVGPRDGKDFLQACELAFG
jgi:hypothetical protein